MAFEPLALHWLNFISLAVLFYFWLGGGATQNAVLGLSYGFGLFLVGVSWVYVSLHQYGGMPLWMGSVAVILFAFVLALFVALPGYCLVKIVPNKHQNPVFRLLAMPCLWVIFEWVKGWMFTGFPWLDAGLSQTPSVTFAFAPIGGVYLVSYVVALMASALVGLLTQHGRQYSFSVILLLCISTGYVNTLTWEKPVGDKLDITVVQGNVPIESKWQSQAREAIIDRYARLTAEASHKQIVDLVVWPETALPLFLSQTSTEFLASLKPKNTALLTGILERHAPNKDYNSAVLVCDGKLQSYRKRHLVPFGEYLPLRFLFAWVLEYLQLPMSDFSAWDGQQVLSCDGNINFSLSICYEDAFANESRKYVGDATVLVNISEDAWFGDTFAPHQRVQIAQMRARELARPLVRSANTGPSVFIDSQGKVIAATGQFEAATLTATIQPNGAITPFKRFGNWIVITALLLLGLLGAVVRARRSL